jgi:hypothetical protein
MPGKCGPDNEEAARAVMFSAPLALAAGMGLLACMLWLWRKVRPELSIDWKPSLVTLAVLGLGLLLSFVGMSEEAEVARWYPAGLLAMGVSYLAVLLVAWRIWLLAEPRRAFTWSFLPAMVIMLWPCPFMLAWGSESWEGIMLVLWVLPGYMGLVCGPLLAVLIIEVVVRLYLNRK